MGTWVNGEEGGMDRWVGVLVGRYMGRWTHVHSWEDIELDDHGSPLCLRSLTTLLFSWKNFITQIL